MALQMNFTEKEPYFFMLPNKRTPLKMEYADTPTTSTSYNELFTSMWGGKETREQNSQGKNVSNETEEGYFDRNETLRSAEIAVLATILYLAIFGNGVVLVVLRLRRQKLSRMQWFIAHLAMADLFVAIFNVLPQLIRDITIMFYGNDFLCRAVSYFQVVSMYASSYVLVMAAIDRYLSICHPLTSQTLSPKRVHLMICMAWCISLAISLPQIFIFRLVEIDTDSYECYAEFAPDWGLKTYVTWVFVADYVIPFLILAFCYGRICHVVWVSVGSKGSSVYVSVRNGNHEATDKSFKMKISFRRMRDQQNCSVQSRDRTDASSVITSSSASKKPRGHQRGVSRSKMKTVKLTLTVVLCYLFCWAPYFLVNLLTVFDSGVNMEDSVVVILMLLASLNSCTNPWIYLAFSGRPCPRGPPNRHASRSWGPSTHLTSGDSNETKSRTSLIDFSHTRLSSRNSSPRFLEEKEHINSKC